MTLQQWGILAGILVAVGGFGTWWLGRRVRLRVTPVRLEARGSRTLQAIGIEVHNVGRRVVAVDEVGYALSGAALAPIVPAVTLQNEALPVRLRPGDRLTVRGPLLDPDLRVLSRADGAYAVTACGTRATGTSADFRTVVEFAGKLFPPSAVPTEAAPRLDPFAAGPTKAFG